MYQPVFKGPIEGWTVNYTKPQFWRVESIMEWADLLQEAYIVFMRVAAKYPALDEPKHFMSLYKRAWVNQFTDLSNEATKLRTFVTDHTEAEGFDRSMTNEPVGETDNGGFLATALRQAPEEVRRVLALMLHAPQEMLDIILADWRGHSARRTDGGGGRINQALGLAPDIDVYKIVQDYLRH